MSRLSEEKKSKLVEPSVESFSWLLAHASRV